MSYVSITHTPPPPLSAKISKSQTPSLPLGAYVIFERPLTPSRNFHAIPTGGRLATSYDLTCNKPHTRRIFGGTGFEPGALRPQSRGLATRPPRLQKMAL
ncbi:hypothetical protein AVEN_67026-1 [Araneus ventricosus]|uniref:Uncharacterized protein n=1 Tax=Araneus ventricosus TaxID=182803 RepID=A0A4Y2E405_ARAVE|nr:hypothetical protein AVEN_67026-1 [Araneus ventricosus]